MHPHDSHTKSQTLTTQILSSTTPPQILSALTSTITFLHHTTPEHSRSFFTLTFPTLISKFFGFENSSNGWIDLLSSSNGSDLSNNLFNLFSSNSILMNLILNVDRLNLIKYIFPIERLPEWTRILINNDRDVAILSDLCTVFKGRIKEESIKGNGYRLELNVFEYFMLWFAYYPVFKGNYKSATSVKTDNTSKKFRLENWASSFKGFTGGKRGNVGKEGCPSLYVRLLYAYLKAFVPVCNVNMSPYRSSLLMNYAYGYDGDGLGVVRGEFLVNALVQFWLVDNDFSPVSVGVCKSFGVSFPFRMVLGETLPDCGLAEVVKLFVKYLSLNFNGGSDGADQVECNVIKTRDVGLVSPCIQSVGSWNTLVQRPLYRFILRSFLFCPVETSIKNASEVFSLWICYMEPWKISSEDFVELDAVVDKSVKKGSEEDKKSQASCGYSSSWQGYVLSNYLYYSSLVMHFIGFAHKFLHADAEIIVQMVLKVINILTESKELMKLIRDMDSAFHSQPVGSSKSALNNMYTFVPSIREQLQDWEDGLCESDVDGSFLHENWNKDLRLFSDGEDGGQQLLQLFVLRSESEVQAISGDNLARNLQYVDSLKSQVSCLFGGHIVGRMSLTPEALEIHNSRDEIFKPRKIGKNTLSNVKYKGDWMKRPISENEVAWLARLLVRVSGWINESLGLNQEQPSHSSSTCYYVDVSGDPTTDVYGPTETLKTILCSIGSWILMVGLAVVDLMKKHGWRVNLRMLASKQVMMVLLVVMSLFAMRKAFGLFLHV